MPPLRPHLVDRVRLPTGPDATLVAVVEQQLRVLGRTEDTMMTIRQRIDTVLRGELPDRVPFTIYPMLLPRGTEERRLRERGLGFSYARTPVVRWEFPNCQVSTRPFQEAGRRFERVTWTTPVGDVWSTNALDGAYGSTWAIDHPIRTRDDYRVLIFIADDARPVPCYDDVRMLQQDVGDDGYVFGSLGVYSPLMEIVLKLVGSATYGFEMADNPDPFWSLYEALRGKALRAFPLAAQSPVRLVSYDGNVHPQLIGAERFARCILPLYEELAGLLHAEGKLLGTHLDADNRIFLDLIASSGIDVVEAFTPPPDCSVSVAEARAAWPHKIIWSNFPSSVHIAPARRIFETTADLLAQSAPGDRFLIGITEDIPIDRWPTSLNAIADALDEFGTTPTSRQQ